jgi:hypothetical protein
MWTDEADETMEEPTYWMPLPEPPGEPDDAA